MPHELDLLRIFLFTIIIKKHESSSNYKIIVCLIYFDVKIEINNKKNGYLFTKQ